MTRSTLAPPPRLALPLALALVAACASTPETPVLGLAPRGDTVDDYHGTAVEDPYRWLEDSESSETRAWIEAQNAQTEEHLGSIPERDPIHERVAALWTYESFGTPARHGDWYYFSYNDGTLNQPLVVRARDLSGEHEEVLDPNAFSVDGTVSLGGTAFSQSGRYLAYGTSDGGSDWRTWRVRDLETGRDLPDVIDWSRFSTPSWAADDSGFYYGRYPETEDRLTAPALNQTVWFHRLGTAQSEDALVHEDPENPERGFGASVTDDGRYVVMFVREGTARKNRLWFRDLQAGPEAEWVRVFDEFDAQYLPLGNQESTFWIWTDKDAPLGRVVTVDVSAAGNPLQTIVPEQRNVLESASMIGGRLVLHYLVDAISRVVLHELDGSLAAEVDLPGVGSARGFRGKQDEAETFFSFSSYMAPTSTYRLEVGGGGVELVRRPEVPFDSDRFDTRQVFYSSADGTRVPMFLTYRRGIELDGSHPTLLYGYGGFNIPMRPGFSPATAAWLDLGGIYAAACLRGGGEYGREWHMAGTLERKQNVFDDFVAAAEWLIGAGYTSSEKLAIAGGSNGGLLVGACLNQRPDLFAAALPAVGVMDMLRYHLFTVGAAWASDYGRSDDPEMFPHLLAYSPYHNARPGTSYPATMVTTADHDDRVVPAHSFKYAAAMQHAQAGDAPVLIRIETRAGHGAGKSREQAIEEVADRWAFLVEHLGMQVGEPSPR